MTSENGDNFIIEGVEEDKKMKKRFIKSRVNKVEDSYRSPITQECYPTPISNYFIPINLTKIERNLNMVADEYCSKLYLGNYISSMFFSTYNKDQVINFMVFKELPVDGEYVKGGVFQIRISIESDQTNMKASGYLEYRVRIEDEDGTKRVIDGSLFKSEDTKLKPDKTADKQFNYKEIGSLIEKLENTLYQNLYFVSLKTRLSVGEDVKLFKNNPERNVFMRAVFNESMKMKGPGVANPSQGSSAQSKNYGSMIADRKPRWGVK